MKNLKTLLVDDEEEFVSTLAERLQLRGFQTMVANDGESALKIVKKDPPQVIILDVMMPGIGGLEVLKQVKLSYPEIPVILLTGHGAEKEGNEGMILGAFDYLMKPLNITQLIQKIHEAVKNV